MKRKSNRRDQTPKPRGPRPRSAVFEDEKRLADVEAARGKKWLDSEILEEIATWKEWI